MNISAVLCIGQKGLFNIVNKHKNLSGDVFDVVRKPEHLKQESNHNEVNAFKYAIEDENTDNNTDFTSIIEQEYDEICDTDFEEEDELEKAFSFPLDMPEELEDDITSNTIAIETKPVKKLSSIPVKQEEKVEQYKPIKKINPSVNSKGSKSEVDDDEQFKQRILNDIKLTRESQVKRPNQVDAIVPNKTIGTSLDTWIREQGGEVRVSDALKYFSSKQIQSALDNYVVLKYYNQKMGCETLCI